MHWQTPLHPVTDPTAGSRFLARRSFVGVQFLKTDTVVGRSGEIVGYIASDLYIPVWETSVVLLLLPGARIAVILLRRRRQRHRHLNQLCLHCGYDLRASTDRCPECGEPIVAGGGGRVG